MSVKYDFPEFNPDLLEKENIDRLAVEQVPSKSFVIDIGCATGFIGEYLRKKKECEVFGIDIRKEEIQVAKKRLQKAIVIDIEKKDSVKKILKETRNKKFDVILATSVIEHLKNHDLALFHMKQVLKPGGIIIASTPNVVHWTMRLDMLKGKFDYNEYGILDNTHLHFFTIQTFKEYFEKNGLKTEKMLYDTVGGGYPRISRFLGKFFPNLFAYQILIIAQKPT